MRCVCVGQLGTLGAGNHYAEIQVVEEIFDEQTAKRMGIDRVNQVVIMIHSGSRGLGHQGAYTLTNHLYTLHMWRMHTLEYCRLPVLFVTGLWILGAGRRLCLVMSFCVVRFFFCRSIGWRE
jgi:hypothetical protein